MDNAQLNWLTNFIWNIADDVLRAGSLPMAGWRFLGALPHSINAVVFRP